MRPALHFPSLSRDVLLEIFSHLEVDDASALIQTCKALYTLGRSRSVWVIAALRILERRPLPLPIFNSGTLDTLDIYALRRVVKRASDLEKNWSLPEASPKRATRVLHIERGFKHDEHRTVDWMFPLPGNRHLVTYHLDGHVTCWDLNFGRIVAQTTIGPRAPSTSDFAMRADDILLVGVVRADANSARLDEGHVLSLNFSQLDTEEPRARFEVLHLENLSLSSRGCFAYPDLVGYLRGREDMPFRLIIVDPSTRRKVDIDTAVITQDDTLDVIKCRDHILFYTERSTSATLYYFNMTDVDAIMKSHHSKLVTLPPSQIRTIKFAGSPVDIMTSRFASPYMGKPWPSAASPIRITTYHFQMDADNGPNLFTGRTFFTHCVLDMASKHGGIIEHSDDHHRFYHAFDDNENFFQPAAFGRPLWAHSLTGKHSAWLQESRSTDLDLGHVNVKLKFASFGRMGANDIHDSEGRITTLNIPSSILSADDVTAITLDEAFGSLFVSLSRGEVYIFDFA